MVNNIIKSKNNFATIWISGVTASGKTTLGKMLYEDLINSGIVNVKLLDGDDLRKKLNRVYGFSAEERFKAIKQFIKTVKNENNKGNIVIIAVVSHRQASRNFARRKIINFFEINLLCSTDTCKKRDHKNIYSKIGNKKNECLPGVTEPYEISDEAELIIDTEHTSIEDSKMIIFNKVFEFLKINIINPAI